MMMSSDETFEISLDCPEILKIVVEICTRKVCVTFYLVDNIEEKIAKEITAEKLDQILDEAAFTFEAFVSRPNIEKININGGGTKELQGKILPCVPVLKASINDFKSSLEENKKYSIYYRLYREAMRSDSISSFLLLYSLLAMIKGPQQKEIDKFIFHEVPDTLVRQSTKNNGKETIYTFLRNQVGHTQMDSNINEVEWEIEKYITQLSKLVKKAIEVS